MSGEKEKVPVVQDLIILLGPLGNSVNSKPNLQAEKKYSKCMAVQYLIGNQHLIFVHRVSNIT